MFRNLCSVIALLALTGTAYAAEMDEPKGDFGWRAMGEAHQISEGHVYWVGTFTGTFASGQGPGGFMHHAAWHCPAVNDLDFNKGVNHASGYCTFTDVDGDVGIIKWSGTGDTATTDGISEWVSGTGKYEGISGTFEWTGYFGPTHPDGTSTGWTDMKGGSTMLP